MSDPGLTHVIFPLIVDADGWPPVSAERVWARAAGPDLYELMNAPWFALGVAEGDTVRAIAASPDTWPVYAERVAWSGHYAIRVIPLRNGPLAGDQQAVLDAFDQLGVSGEGSGTYQIVALTVPRTANLHAVKQLLHNGRADGRWDWEEGCIDDRWIDA